MDGVRRIEPAHRRIRARTEGEWVIDTVDIWLLFEPDRHPIFAIPVGAVPPLAGGDDTEADERDGRWVGLAGRPDRRVRLWPTAPSDLPELAGLAAVPLDVADEWYEEDVPLVFKPRDPYRRVDVLESSRHVKVAVDGSAVAETDRPRLVLETGMPPIWYVPLLSVDSAAMRPASLRTRCQYKGEAHYWDVMTGSGTHANLAWGYPEPIGEAAGLAGHVAFAPWHPEVTTTVDGITHQVEAPSPGWSNPTSRLPCRSV